MANGKKTGGRKAGTPNKLTAQLKDAILQAATLAGNEEGLIGYLRQQAITNPSPFMALLGKVLPLQIAGDKENPLEIIRRIERVIVPVNEEDAEAVSPTEH